ncbi:MAG: ATP-binding cassette domain-containing protein [Bauldia sp.]
MADAAILEVDKVAAGYGGRAVFRDVDVAVGGGEILGLLGANGSGKSTLVKAITGQIPLLAGRIAIGGIDLTASPERAKAELGLAVEIGDLPDALTGRQYCEMVASIRGCAPDAFAAPDVVEALGVSRWLDRPIAAYSLGTRMKTAILGALLGAPKLLIFDESLNGLDPVSAFRMKRIIADLAGSGRHAVLLSTHVVETIPTLCSRAVFLADGRIVETWDKAGLTAAAASPGGFEARVMDALLAAAPKAA